MIQVVWPMRQIWTLSFKTPPKEISIMLKYSDMSSNFLVNWTWSFRIITASMSANSLAWIWWKSCAQPTVSSLSKSNVWEDGLSDLVGYKVISKQVRVVDVCSTEWSWAIPNIYGTVQFASHGVNGATSTWTDHFRDVKLFYNSDWSICGKLHWG